MKKILQTAVPRTVFEDIRRADADGSEHWLARELATVLDYVQYRNFLQVVDKARRGGLAVTRNVAASTASC